MKPQNETSVRMKPARSTRSLVVRLVALAAVLALVAILLKFVPKSAVVRGLESIQNLGPWGPVMVGVLYVPAAVLLIPGTILTLFAGFAFDVVPAIIAVSLGSTIGAAAAFLVGRKVARRFVERRVAKYPKFHAIDRAVAGQGFKIVLLIRLSPVIPFNLSNYAFGLTQISFARYVLASWLGMFPASLVYVYVGRTAGSLAELTSGADNGQSGGIKTALIVVGLIATVVVTIFVTRLARQALNQAVEEAGEGPL